MIACAGLCLLAATQLQAQHGHLNAGADSWDQGSKLRFDNGAEFTPASYLKTMVYSNTGRFASTFNGNISLTVLHSIDGLGEKVPGSPAPGAFIVAEIVSVKGPEGGNFSFWNEAGPQLVIPVGTTNGAFRYELSDASLGAGQPGNDPFGHIHGRRFALDKPGIYEVGFRVVDISTNGVGGGPIHTPSDVLPIMFQSGINIAAIEPQEDRVRIRFGSMTNFLWQIESIESLGSTNWQAVGDRVNGWDSFMDIEDIRPPVSSRYYRVKGEATSP
jgi:hypothetical protein